MLQLGVEIGFEVLLRGSVEDSPYGAAAIAVFRVWAEGVAGLEGEVFLDAVDGGEVVVFEFAELEEARDVLGTVCSVIGSRCGGGDLLFAELGSFRDFEIDYYIAGGGLEEDRHGGVQ